MKRPFSFNLTPIKVPPKAEIKVVKSSNSTNSIARPLPRPDSCSPPPSPFICRRALSGKTEAQLRAACALILENYKPSGHVFEDNAKPKLDFDALNRSMREKKRDAEAFSRAVDNRAHLRSLPKPETVVKDLYPGSGSAHAGTKANSSRRREDRHPHAMDTERAARRAAKSQPSADRPKTAPMRNTVDSDDSSDQQVKTPLTSSTGYFYNNASTAPTSAAFSSSPGSKRDSRLAYPNDNAVADTDAAAAEWMKQELERRRQNMLSLGEPPAFNNAVRPPSRSRSIKEEFREYIRPLSRSASKESMRSNSLVAQEPQRSSGHGWRSWSLHRKTSLSSFKDSRPNSSGGRTETCSDEAPKVELNLNRELPPLPSLDKWEDHAAESAKDEQHAQRSSTHIASLMLPKVRGHQQHDQPAAAPRHKHRRSGSDSLAQTFPRDTTLYSPAQNVKMPRPKSSLPKNRPNQSRYDSSITFDSTMEPTEPSRHTTEEARARTHRHKKTASSVSQITPSMKVSIDQYRYEPPNFSRKISMDVVGRAYNEFPPHNEKAVSKPSGHDKMQKLRKAVSGWMLNKKKDRKENRTDISEQTAVKGNLTGRSEAAHAPVVKY
ncbi:hypothetical protein BU16DRAFT_580576 [Lophium mytilinum]|uniref:Uncharacterized protein n=1 Tax=Lophium mytilinum TaxID=390894 RepID=A0A6A6R277_9PEZI|nr:hypothetical protein BU16DRAFT_580576 [Lophium mytilinum]